MNIEDIVSTLNENKLDYKEEMQKFYVYALYDDEEIVYIGQSIQLHSRIKSHESTKKFNKYSFVVCETHEEMARLEAELIINLQPKYNVQAGSQYISTKSFRKMIKDMAGDNYNRSMYINKIRENLINNDVEIINFKGIDHFDRDEINRAIKIILG